MVYFVWPDKPFDKGDRVFLEIKGIIPNLCVLKRSDFEHEMVPQHDDGDIVEKEEEDEDDEEKGFDDPSLNEEEEGGVEVRRIVISEEKLSTADENMNEFTKQRIEEIKEYPLKEQMQTVEVFDFCVCWFSSFVLSQIFLDFSFGSIERKFSTFQLLCSESISSSSHVFLFYLFSILSRFLNKNMSLIVDDRMNQDGDESGNYGGIIFPLILSFLPLFFLYISN